MRNACWIVVLLGLASPAAWAGDYRDFPAPEPYPFERSQLTRKQIVLPPYDQPFGVRVYSTPPQGPCYNVPPYAVIVPY